mmetsp:Transcript_63096/g.77198  ORF Transcript_63096/g.77198 Transcript_63096/m.77198 type:complete len:148 (+) Transcript_63096:3-446(+)
MYSCTGDGELISQSFNNKCQNADTQPEIISKKSQYNCEKLPPQSVVYKLQDDKGFSTINGMGCNISQHDDENESFWFQCKGDKLLNIYYTGSEECDATAEQERSLVDHTENVMLFNCADDNKSDAARILGPGWTVVIVGFICLLLFI